jgi:ABC-type sugar transport system ATPase subunit
LVGSGRSELAQAICGIEKSYHGELKLNGKKIHMRSAKDAIQKGITYLPEDRQTQGLVLQMDLKSNITLAVLQELLKFSFIDRKKEFEITTNCIQEFKIMTTGPNQIVHNLSGGNQQRVLVSKWLNVRPSVLFMDEPTRGIDVGTKAELYNLINRLSESNITIILISSELPEVIGMSHRILVMNSGTLTAEFKRGEATREMIMQAALK